MEPTSRAPAPLPRPCRPDARLRPVRLAGRGGRRLGRAPRAHAHSGAAAGAAGRVAGRHRRRLLQDGAQGLRHRAGSRSRCKSTVPYSIPEGSLILFQAKGPAIEEIGGIAHGMSGSPLYVADTGGDKLVGAVSYGDIFTRGYLGLATPVEYMAAMEDTFLPNPAPLALPGRCGSTASPVARRRSRARRARLAPCPEQPARPSWRRSPPSPSPACRRRARPTSTSPRSSKGTAATWHPTALISPGRRPPSPPRSSAAPAAACFWPAATCCSARQARSHGTTATGWSCAVTPSSATARCSST